MPKTKRIFTAKEKKNQNSPKYKVRKKLYRLRNYKGRNKCRRLNYMKNRPVVRKNKPWSICEMHCLMQDRKIFSDKYLALYLGRSVQAIQQKRYMLNKESYENRKIKN